jgi:hypothetical protein
LQPIFVLIFIAFNFIPNKKTMDLLTTYSRTGHLTILFVTCLFVTEEEMLQVSIIIGYLAEVSNVYLNTFVLLLYLSERAAYN